MRYIYYVIVYIPPMTEPTIEIEIYQNRQRPTQKHDPNPENRHQYTEEQVGGFQNYSIIKN